MSRYEYDYKWCNDKKRMVKIKKQVELDNEVGTEDSLEVSRELLEDYIDNEYFIENDFDIRKLKKELPLPRKDRDISVDVYIEFMENYLNRIRHGRRPDKSYYVSAPDSFGKKMFVYQAIKDALKHGLEPTRLIDTHRLYTLLDKNDYKGFYKYFEGKDMVFLTMGGAPVNTGLIVVKTALDYCERKGIPLLVISRFSPELFYKADTFTGLYLGVRSVKKGNLGQMELAGFDLNGMNMIREEIQKRMGLERENLRKRRN